MNYAELHNTICSTLESYEPTFVATIPTFVKQTEERVFTEVLFPAMLRTSTGACTLGSRATTCPADMVAVARLSVIEPGGRKRAVLPKDISYLDEAYPDGGATGIPRYYAVSGDPAGVTDVQTFALGPTPAAAYPLELIYYHFPDSIVQGVLSTATIASAGSGYANGTYYNVSLTQPQTGATALATITVSTGGVTAIEITYGGAFFIPGAPVQLTQGAAQVGTVGSGAAFTANAVTNVDGRSWLGDTYSPVLLYGALVEAAIFLKLEEDMMKAYKAQYDAALATATKLGKALLRVDANRP